MKARIQALLIERLPSVMIIDSFKALTPYAADEREYRTFLHELAGAVSAVRGSAFWLGEYGVDEIAGCPSSPSPTA